MPLFVTITFLTQPLNWILFSNFYGGVFQLDAVSGMKSKDPPLIRLSWDAPCASRGVIILIF